MCSAYDPAPGFERDVAEEVSNRRRTWLDSLITLSCKSMCKLAFSLRVEGDGVEPKMTAVSSEHVASRHVPRNVVPLSPDALEDSNDNFCYQRHLR